MATAAQSSNSTVRTSTQANTDLYVHSLNSHIAPTWGKVLLKPHTEIAGIAIHLASVPQRYAWQDVCRHMQLWDMRFFMTCFEHIV